jgi:hypothetical protein
MHSLKGECPAKIGQWVEELTSLQIIANKTIYIASDLFLTLRSPAPTMQPESSDGFASVGTILPEEGAALLPGGSFRFCLIF